MAVFSGDLRSESLAMDTHVHVILPYDRPAEDQPVPCKVLYLLHGLGENSGAWTRYTGIERYARDYGVAVIMPEVQRSFYYDMAMGMAYFTYITEELPQLCGQLFHVSGKREDTFVAGLSMGGYGALKCGLSRPDRYAGCAGFSSLCDIGYIMEGRMDDGNRLTYQSLFGLDLQVREEDDLFRLAERLSLLPAEQRPSLLFTCGQEDFLYSQNLRLRDKFQSLGLEHSFHHWPGDHEWGFWDRSVQLALRFFFR